ncbi:S8 family serine peptidase [Streptomyces roseirectus]|uniref:S8 family serine peptidase n=1 Tax=Streptomyces roseirectus TaxID=2768066 RepID=A0A7H0I708_9ACTN|nr:S8 family serine peptidase [Streptomyces roseirectus]QNP68574.1 S8 family serine peptidase [Streptomyces roseirectus]
MSQHHPGRRRTGGRTALLLTPALLAGLALTSGPAAQASNAPADAARRTTYAAGTYLVQLADQPVAAHPGTAPAGGARLNTRSQAVRDYTGRLTRERDRVLERVAGVEPLHTYQYVLNGFAARLTARQASELARTPGVVSLTPNEIRRPADDAPAEESVRATAPAGTQPIPEPPSEPTSEHLPVPDTAAFLGLKERTGLYAKTPGGQRDAGEGTIIGVLDSGIDTDNPSLRALPEPRPDARIIAAKWKGACDRGADTAHQVTCNNKVIGAQYFNQGLPNPTKSDWASPRDSGSYGTHIATTAAGDMDVPAHVPGTAISGRVSGIAPAARIAVYKVCWSVGCPTVDVVAGFDKAVADGVDVINYSVGSNALAATPEYTAMFNAAKAGVFIAASAANSGPGTVRNNVPWVTTVAASTHDTGYRTTVTLGDGKTYEGAGISDRAVPSAPLVDAAKAAKSGADVGQAELCQPGTLDPAKVKGAVVLCRRGQSVNTDTSVEVESAGGVGIVLYNPNAVQDRLTYTYPLPRVHLDNTAGAAVKAYADGPGATVRLSAARAVAQRAPQIAAFSSGGPNPVTGDLLKPDLAAPGLDIVAGTTPGGDDGRFTGEQGIMSGTSMATPHVAGLALLLRARHPDWSPMEIRSALMTTATTTDRAGEPITRIGTGRPATPLDYGAGQAVPNRADDPGLVYDSTPADWTAYNCAVTGAPVTAGDSCPTGERTAPSDLNYPTISVGALAGKQTVTRTVTNVSAATGVYTAELRTPPGYRAEVTPKELVVKPGASAGYRVTFTRTDAAYGDWAFGSLTWHDRQGHRVRSAVALRATPLAVAAEATGEGATGSVALAPKPGWDGTLTTAVNGLYAGTAETGTLTGTNPDFAPGRSPLPAATIRTRITVPEGTELARVAIRSADHLPGSDLDLWVLDKNGDNLVNLVTGNDEHVDLTEPGTYDVYLNQYALPQGATGQTYTLRTWLIGKGTRPDHTATATPAEQPVTRGTPTGVTVSWQDLPAGRPYLGLIGYGDGTGAVGRTLLSVTP